MNAFFFTEKVKCKLILRKCSSLYDIQESLGMLGGWPLEMYKMIDLFTKKTFIHNVYFYK